MTYGTAKITTANGAITVEFMRSTNFSVGMQIFGDCREGATAALRFCRERGLRVVECR